MITVNYKNKLSYVLAPIFLLCTRALKIQADGAGILPFVKEKNQVFFLVSEDRHRSGVWTDFGGQGKARIDDAAKEGHEETMGIFTGHHKSPYLQKDNAIQLLKQKLNEKKSLRKYFSGGFEYATYLFDSTKAVQRLGGMKKTMKLFYSTLARLKEKSCRVYHCYCEKVSFLWVTKKELLQAIDKNESINGKKLFSPFRENLLRHRELIVSL